MQDSSKDRTPAFSIAPCGDDALLVDFGDQPDANTLVRAAWRGLSQNPRDYGREAIAGVATLAVILSLPFRNQAARAKVIDALEHDIKAFIREPLVPGREVVLPVCYDASMAPDLSRVAKLTGLSVSEIIACHQAVTYDAQLIGFMPGFAYLQGLDKRLDVPRLATPRTAVPPGALGITGSQCAVYPSATPGGWNLIGRCPVRMFDGKREKPCAIELGDQVRFESISLWQFESLWKAR